MANRCNLKEGESLQILLDKITEVLKSSDALQELNQNRKNKILRENTGDEELLKSLFQSLPLDKDLLNGSLGVAVIRYTDYADLTDLHGFFY